MSPHRSVLALLSVVSAVACADKKPTALTIAVSSEVPVPDTVNRVQIRVEYDGAERFDKTYDFDVSGGDTKIPGTLTIERQDETATGPVRVTVSAVNRDTMGASVVRHAVVGFSEERTKLVRMPLRFSCLDFPDTCKEGETCKAGACASASADAEGLPDYDDAQVFGKTGDGRCFDRALCVPKDLIVDLTAVVRATTDARCEVALADGVTSERVNFGVVWSRHPAGKWTAVDQDPEEGWSFADAAKTRVQFAPGLCRAIRGQTPGVEVAKVIVNPACPPKKATQPECL